MRILALMIVTGVFLLLLFLAITFGVAMGIVLGYMTINKKGRKECEES